MYRRTFLQKTTAAAAGLATSSLHGAATPPASRIVDTHTHFYDPTRKEGVPWPGKGTQLYRTVLPKDWLAVSSPLGVRETVVVEASKLLEDNAWILELAAVEKSIVGFVGHLSPLEADFAKHLKRFAANPIFRGIRISGAELSENLDKAEFRSGVVLMADMGLQLDVNGPASGHLPAARLAAAVPALRMVINHVGGAGDAAHLSDEWRAGMAALGKQKNVFCKVSALMEQTREAAKQWGKAPHDTAYYAPILDHCWECFGEDRLVYGSDWPVAERGGTYADQFHIVSEYFAAKGRDACEKYFWKNSREAYRWVERAPK